MTVNWTLTYFRELEERFGEIASDLSDRLSAITQGQAAPSLESIAIGSARDVTAGVLVFDVRKFSARSSTPEEVPLKVALAALDCVVPMVSQVIYDHGGYVEKNTGDGVLGVIGAGDSVEKIANSLLDAAATIHCVIRDLVNPRLLSWQVAPIEFRMGLDLGRVLLARIGLPKGSSEHQRSFLTAVGPAAVIATRLQQAAGTNETWVGNLPMLHSRYPASHFTYATPSDWSWVTVGDSAKPYNAWKFDGQRQRPMDLARLLREQFPRL